MITGQNTTETEMLVYMELLILIHLEETTFGARVKSAYSIIIP